jgi:hypothetical protein
VTRRRTKSCDEAPVQTYLTVSKRSCVRLSCRSGEGGALSGGVKSETRVVDTTDRRVLSFRSPDDGPATKTRRSGFGG